MLFRSGVPNGEVQSLAEKWVVTISTQYGCSMNCKFCDVPKVGPGKNATYNDLINQVTVALEQHPEITATKRLNIHFARMGEPTWNDDVLLAARDIRKAVRRRTIFLMKEPLENLFKEYTSVRY